MFVDDEFDGGDGTDSGLWGSIINATSQVAQTAIIANGNNPSLQTPYPQPYSSGGFTPDNFNRTSGAMSWVVVIVLAVVGYFVFTKIK